VQTAKLAMAFHCYQPVDNFDREVERAYRSAYLPLVSTFEEFPGLKASFHFSGNLLEWFEDKHPEYLVRLRELALDGQIELIGGGCYEPVMVLIPERDRIAQLRMNEEIMVRMFGERPRGVWMAEKVWEPELIGTLAASGVEYTIIDDYHLMQAGAEEEAVYGPCLTREGDRSMVLFPSLTRFRYTMPFRQPRVTLDHMKRVTERRCGEVSCFFFADDGEKFGHWPHTYSWVYRKGWLRNFLGLLRESSGWLQTATYSEIMDTVKPKDIGEVPGSSYAEMMEWSGGDFRNFMKKYPEAGRMRGRMISVSDQLGALLRERTREGILSERVDEARRELFKAQASCAYWHGTFGGVYMPHLREGVYSHLIRAQEIIDGIGRPADREDRVRAVERELEPGGSETLISNGYVDVFVRSCEGGSVSEIDCRKPETNITNVMSRVRESYHKKLGKGCAQRAKKARRAIMSGDFADIHDVLGAGERGLDKILFYDDYRRRSFLTHVITGKAPWNGMHRHRMSNDRFLKEAYSSTIFDEGGDIVHVLRKRDKVFVERARGLDLEVVKKVRVGRGPAVIFNQGVTKHTAADIPFKCALEFNFSVCDGTVLAGPILKKTDSFELRDRYSGLRLGFDLNGEFTVFMYPVYTVNETEAGLKKTYQGVSVLVGDQIGPGAANKPASDMEIALEIR